MTRLSDTGGHDCNLAPHREKVQAPRLPPRLSAALVDWYLADPRRKPQLVVPLFDEVAPRYDRFTRLFSLGQDARWKKWIVERLTSLVPSGGIVLDVACGTGDLALAVAQKRQDVTVVALDPSLCMLKGAARRIHALQVRNVTLVRGDIDNLPFRDASFDAVSGGYAVRNAPCWQGALSSLARILRSGGQLLTLDFYLPSSPVWARIFLAYLRIAGNAVGWWWHRQPLVYGYIARSIAHFTSAAGLATELKARGFAVEEHARHLGGAIALHRARKR